MIRPLPITGYSLVNALGSGPDEVRAGLAAATTPLATPDIPLPFAGDDLYAELSADSGETELLMVIVETLDGGVNYLGYAGGIPGALTPSPRAAITLSWLANSGVDGHFNEDDIRLFGETMAHEASHYMGLFHPVEESLESRDALEDTQDCEPIEDCEERYGDNLMFPYPICSFSGCLPQERLTSDQTGVLHRYTGVRDD